MVTKFIKNREIIVIKIYIANYKVANTNIQAYNLVLAPDVYTCSTTVQD